MNQPSQMVPQPNSSKLIWILVAVLIILVIAGGIWYWRVFQPAQTTVIPSPSPSATQATEIKNDSDLQKVQGELDSTDIDSLDSALSQNDADAAQF